MGNLQRRKTWQRLLCLPFEQILVLSILVFRLLLHGHRVVELPVFRVEVLRPPSRTHYVSFKSVSFVAHSPRVVKTGRWDVTSMLLVNFLV